MTKGCGASSSSKAASLIPKPATCCNPPPVPFFREDANSSPSYGLIIRGVSLSKVTPSSEKTNL